MRATNSGRLLHPFFRRRSVVVRLCAMSFAPRSLRKFVSQHRIVSVACLRV